MSRLIHNGAGGIVPWIERHFLALLLVVFYLTEAYSKILKFSTNHYAAIPRILKIGCLILFIAALLIHNRKKIIWYLILPLTLFCLGQLFLNEGYSANSFVILSKYIYPLLLFVVVSNKIRDRLNLSALFTTFELLVLANCLLVFIGFIFSIKYFQTYQYSRFGYDGLLLTSATATYVYFIALFYFALTITKNPLSILKFITVLIACVLTGTKAIFIGVVVVVMLLLYQSIASKLKRLYLGLILILFMCIGYLLFFEFGMFNEIREKDGLLSSLLSGRDQLFVERTWPFIENNWNKMNYLFGGFSTSSVRSQMSFVDLVLFWGIIGGIIYMFLFVKSFVTFKLTGSLILILFTLLCMITLAGNFFFYAAIPLYLLILRERIHYLQENEYPSVFVK